jgi:hypothetical protein
MTKPNNDMTKLNNETRELAADELNSVSGGGGKVRHHRNTIAPHLIAAAVIGAVGGGLSNPGS